jgi:hypothetical protein
MWEILRNAEILKCTRIMAVGDSLNRRGQRGSSKYASIM